MRVNSIPPREQYYRYVHAQTQPAAVKSFQGADRVQLTGEAVLFSSVLKSARDAITKTDGQKAADVKNMIDSGNYSVSGYEVAGRMLGGI